MSVNKGRFEELAQRLAARTMELRTGVDKTPALRLVTNEPLAMDTIARESHYRMIRHIRWRRGKVMQMLIDQACFGLIGIEQLDDQALINLHKNLERAEDCIREGVAFDDAGLLVSNFD